jgi:hypothetical protein
MVQVLRLTLRREPFLLIASGEKVVEYRDFKPYWEKRLMSGSEYRKFDFVEFRNGYRADSPKLLVEVKGIDADFTRFSIHLGAIVQ